MIEFDEDRDCSHANTAQDIKVSCFKEMVSIEQWDGTGDDQHCVVVPDHAVNRLIEILQSRQGGVISGLPV